MNVLPHSVPVHIWPYFRDAHILCASFTPAYVVQSIVCSSFVNTLGFLRPLCPHTNNPLQNVADIQNLGNDVLLNLGHMSEFKPTLLFLVSSLVVAFYIRAKHDFLQASSLSRSLLFL